MGIEAGRVYGGTGGNFRRRNCYPCSLRTGLALNMSMPGPRMRRRRLRLLRPSSQDETNDYVPSGFTDEPAGVTATFQYEWVSERTGQPNDWSKFSTPTLWGRYSTDGAGIEFIFRRTINNVAPATPTTSAANDARPMTSCRQAGVTILLVWMQRIGMSGVQNG